MSNASELEKMLVERLRKFADELESGNATTLTEQVEILKRQHNVLVGRVNTMDKKLRELDPNAHWIENGEWKTAPKVDPSKFGCHKWDDHDGTSDCWHGCGCVMGPSASSGPVDPFGACPKNPRPTIELPEAT